MKAITNTYIVLLAFVILLPIADAAKGAYEPAPRVYVKAAQQSSPPPRKTKKRTAWIICKVWQTQCVGALNVAWCESKYELHATNGQYRGLFQLGAGERKTYGHGNNAWKQARAARAYYAISGWTPWECKPNRKRAA